MIDITQRLTPAKGVIGVTVKKISGEIVPEKCTEFEQIFTDYGFTRIYTAPYYTTITGSGTNVGFFGVCKVGTSNVERVVTDTGLGAALTPEGSYVAQGAVATLENIGGINYVKTTRDYLFAPGAFAGVTIREVGIFAANNNTTMMAGQTIKDGLGVNTDITILADEQLRVTYTFYVEVLRVGGRNFTNPANTPPQTIVANSISYSVVIGMANEGCNQTGTSGDSDYVLRMGLGAVGTTNNTSCRLNGGVLSGASYTLNSCITTAYANRITRQCNVKIFPAAGAVNITELKPDFFPGSEYTIITFDPPLPKSAAQTLELSYTHTIKWR